MGHSIESCTANLGLRRLGLQQMGRQVISKDSLEAEHAGFG